MFDFIKKLLGLGPSVDFKELTENGALVIDVRTPAEFKQGHVAGSVNIPLDRIQDSIKKIKGRKKTIITCCRSGNRSGMAAKILTGAGVECYNGGGWKSLERKLA